MALCKGISFRAMRRSNFKPTFNHSVRGGDRIPLIVFNGKAILYNGRLQTFTR